MRALIINDDIAIREPLATFLNERGVDCVICDNCPQALEQYLAHLPKLIIVDWEMPGMDGMELCRQIRSQSTGTQVHFIMLTSFTDEDVLTRAFDAGVDDFLPKPFNNAAMMARLRVGLRMLSIYDEIPVRHQGSKQLNEQLTNMNNRLERLAITDDLTSLYNRRQTMHRLDEHWALSHRYQRPVAIITLDIDNFKQINDVYGHSAGDIVLQGVSEAFRECIRTTDIMGRIGGEEFLIILPCQTAQEAEICAQRCRHAVATREFVFSDHKIQTTISAGIASRRTDMSEAADLLHEADAALYAAKRAGRNAVCSARSDALLEITGLLV